MNPYKGKYYKNNPAVQKAYMKKYILARPWVKFLINASSRCTKKNGPYNIKGIKCLLTVNDLETLWFRDKAWLLQEPSLDRIDGKKHYTFENCRFIELKENSMQGYLNGIGKDRK